MIGSACGIGPAEGIYHPFRDSTISVEDRIRIAKYWLSYYFTKVSDLDGVTHEDLASRVALHETPEFQGDATKTPTLLRIPAERLKDYCDYDALARSSLPILRISMKVFADTYELALFDTGGVLPNVGVVMAWGDESMGDVIGAAKSTWDRVKAKQTGGIQRRHIDFYRIEGGNHMASGHHSSVILMEVNLT